MSTTLKAQSMFRHGDVIQVQINPEVSPFRGYDGEDVFKFLGRVVAADNNGIMIVSSGHLNWHAYVQYDDGLLEPLSVEVQGARFYPWHQVDALDIVVKSSAYALWLAGEVVEA